MTFIILSIIALYLYSGFIIASSDHRKYKILLQFEQDGIELHDEEKEVLAELHEVGGINSKLYRQNMVIYVILWLPLMLADLFYIIKDYLTIPFFFWYEVKIFKLNFNISFYKLPSKSFKVTRQDDQCYIDLVFVGIGVWK